MHPPRCGPARSRPTRRPSVAGRVPIVPVARPAAGGATGETSTSRGNAPFPFAATVSEAVRLSGLSKTALYALLGEGTIEARKRGKTTLVLLDGVRRYVEALPRATFGMATDRHCAPHASINARRRSSKSVRA